MALTQWVAVGLIPAFAPRAEIDGPVDLGQGVQLARLPEYVAALEGLHWERVQWLSPKTEYVLLCPYELETGADPQRTRAAGDTAGDALRQANMAVWLANPGTDVRFRYVVYIDRTRGSQGLRRVSPAQPLYTNRPIETTTRAHLDAARQLNESLARLPRRGPLWVAVRTLWGALREDWFYSRYPQLWTALEALFGPRESDAVTFRISQSLAFFLANTIEDRVPLFGRAKSAYGKRSKVVHGEGEAVPAREHEPLTHQAEDWLRDALVRILRSRDYLAAFQTAKQRDTFFERLVFAEGAEAGVLAKQRV